jgi:hypothetical protein
MQRTLYFAIGLGTSLPGQSVLRWLGPFTMAGDRMITGN